MLHKPLFDDIIDLPLNFVKGKVFCLLVGLRKLQDGGAYAEKVVSNAIKKQDSERDRPKVPNISS